MKIGVIGAGLVGSTAAYALIMRGVGREIVLVDLDAARAGAEADDLYHAVPFAHQLTVSAGDYAQLAGCRLVVIAAGVSQEPGETRLQLLGRNAEVFRQVIPRILKYAPEAILLVATNPVDVMTHLAAHFAGQLGLPSSRVIGSGTTLDTARFRALLGRRLQIDPQHVHAYVLGEHGDSEVLAWSLVTAASLPLDDFCRDAGIQLGPQERDEIDAGVRRAAYSIIEGKGATYYGIGSAIARICEVILRDQRALLTVCTPLEDLLGVQNVTVAMPNLLGGAGVIRTLSQPLTSEEQEALRRSASIVRQAITSLGL
ncbi:MAG: L-lactate dehydrogenase [Anaerolineales bacterium]|nr:L-lactate dehydrogenase [Anaerolineales bacterium]